MAEKFWLDPFYARGASTRRIPLKFTTLYSYSIGGTLFVGLGSLLFTILFLGLIAAILDKELRIARGIQVPAEVMSCEYTPGRSKHAAQMDFILRYRLLDGRSAPLQNSSSIYGDYLYWQTCDDFPIGSKLQVRYQADMPAHVDIVEARLQRPWWNALIMYGGIFAVTAFFLGGLILGLRGVNAYFTSRSHHRAFQRYSQLIEGEIVSCQGQMIGRLRNVLELTICYRFTSPQGTQIQGKQQTTRRCDLIGKPMPGPGTPITILYANDRVYCAL